MLGDSNRPLLTAMEAYVSHTTRGHDLSEYVSRIRSDEVLDWVDYARSALPQPTVSRSKGIRVETWGPTLCFSDSNSYVVVDPGEYTHEVMLRSRSRGELRGILITHGHKDHNSGIGLLLDHFRDTPVLLSHDTLDLLTEIFQRNGDPLSAERLRAQASIAEPQVKAVLGEWTITPYLAGHCLGAISFHILNQSNGFTTLVAGEFTKREVGGFKHNIPRGLTVDALFIDAQHAADAMPTGSSTINRLPIRQAITRCYESDRTPVFGCGSLGEMQEVYAAAAMFQRDGGASKYDLFACGIRDGLKNALARASHLPPWDLPVRYSDVLNRRAINLVSGGFEREAAGLFWELARTEQQDYFDWFVPMRFSEGQCDRIRGYPVYTHASLPELLELVLATQAPSVCLCCGGSPGSQLVGALASIGYSVHDAAGNSCNFVL